MLPSTLLEDAPRYWVRFVSGLSTQRRGMVSYWLALKSCLRSYWSLTKDGLNVITFSGGRELEGWRKFAIRTFHENFDSLRPIVFQTYQVHFLPLSLYSLITLLTRIFLFFILTDFTWLSVSRNRASLHSRLIPIHTFGKVVT